MDYMEINKVNIKNYYKKYVKKYKNNIIVNDAFNKFLFFL